MSPPSRSPSFTPSRCSFLPTTWPFSKARTWISPGIWRRALRWSENMSRNEALGALINLQMGFLKSACLYVVAKLEVADQLAHGERSSDEIARHAKADPDYLYRVMRLLATDGVFEEKAGRVFALTPL